MRGVLRRTYAKLAWAVVPELPSDFLIAAKKDKRW